jgi:excisionase family DNA binding protein
MKEHIMPKNRAGCALEQRFLSVEQIAKDLGVSEDFVRGLIRSGELPAYRVGKKEYRVKTSDYEHFLEERKIKRDDTD